MSIDASESTSYPSSPRFLTFPPNRLASAAKTQTKLTLVDFRSGESVSRHPELAPLIAEGWTVRSAVPRIVETDGPQLLVVLTKPAEAADQETPAFDAAISLSETD